MAELHKYPRTHHLEGSGLQPGDEALESISFREIDGCYLVIEEKMDGANAGIRFTADGELLLQSRGHYLIGGERERQFDLFKAWARRHAGELWELLGDRYILYGEWLYAKHTLFYTELPHYFLEFDLYDTATAVFLSTERRSALLERSPFIVSVRVIREGVMSSLGSIVDLIRPSPFIASDYRSRLEALCAERGLDAGKVLRETDASGLMEGLYIKAEDGGVVTGRYKYVRSGFLTTVIDSGSHWMDRPMIPNGLRPGVSLF